MLGELNDRLDSLGLPDSLDPDESLLVDDSLDDWLFEEESELEPCDDSESEPEESDDVEDESELSLEDEETLEDDSEG